MTAPLNMLAVLKSTVESLEQLARIGRAAIAEAESRAAIGGNSISGGMMIQAATIARVEAARDRMLDGYGLGHEYVLGLLNEVLGEEGNANN